MRKALPHVPETVWDVKSDSMSDFFPRELFTVNNAIKL